MDTMVIWVDNIVAYGWKNITFIHLRFLVVKEVVQSWELFIKKLCVIVCACVGWCLQFFMVGERGQFIIFVVTMVRLPWLCRKRISCLFVRLIVRLRELCCLLDCLLAIHSSGLGLCVCGWYACVFSNHLARRGVPVSRAFIAGRWTAGRNSCCGWGGREQPLRSCVANVDFAFKLQIGESSW